MTVCQAPALLGRPAGVRCARRRLGLRWRAYRWAVWRLVLAGAWWPVAGQRPGLRLQQVIGGGQGGHLGRRAGRRLAVPVTASRAARTAGRSATSRAAGPVFIRGLLRQPSWGAARTHSPGSFEPTRTGDQGQAEPPDGLARAQKRIGYLRICRGRGSSTAGSAPTGRAATKARPPRRRRQGVRIHARRCRAGRRPGTGVGVLVIGEGRNTGMRTRAGTRLAAILIAAGAFLAVPAASALASATHGKVFFNGQVVGTVVTPAAVPNGGTDPFYEVSGGVAGQLGIAGDGPGSPDYRGGLWAVNVVTFTPGTTPFLLTSAQAVLTAQSRGQVTITRDPAADFRCPLQL